MTFSDYELYDGLGLATLVHQGEVTASEVLEAAIEQIELVNPYLNAVVRKSYDKARENAKNISSVSTGFFTGVPLLLKDLVASQADEPTSFGSAWLKHYTRPFDSELVKRYKEAGFIIVGKTNTPEWGLGASTEPKCYGPTHNPWNLNHIAGGSSGGSAAAVAARMVPIAHGGDGGGSLRIPASCCGVFGFKPTRGRTPTGPDYGRLWQGLVTEHVLTRTVRDSAAVLDISAGNDLGNPLYLEKPSDSYLSNLDQPLGSLKIACIREPFFSGTVHEDCLRALNRSVAVCESLGHKVEEVKFSVDADRLLSAFATLVAAETRATAIYFSTLLKKKPRDIELSTHALIKAGKKFSADELVLVGHYFDHLSRKLAELFTRYDLILTPSLATPPPKIGIFQPSGFERFMLRLMTNVLGGLGLRKAIFEGMKKEFAFTPFTALFNATGNPAMSVPLYWNRDHLPIGVQFVGRFADEKTLFQLARQLEQAEPWWKKTPSNPA